MKNKLISILASLTMVLCITVSSFADATNEVITIGANLNHNQKQEILDYFGVSPDNPNIIYINNQQERKYLSGIAPEKQIGKVTMSSSYVLPTISGGINVKTSNITWVTSSMIASTLATAGVENANVVAAAPFPVSGTGALTGIIIAFEKSSGEALTEQKKQLANKELITTGNLAEKIGKDKATGLINDSKKEIIKEGIKDPNRIEDVVNNIANNYNINLNAGDINVIVNLLQDVAKQNYNYSDVKDTLDSITSNVTYNLKAAGENIDFDKILEKVKDVINTREAQSFFNKFDDSKFSNEAITSTTNEGINTAKNIASDLGNKVKSSGILDKIFNFIKSLISGN